MRAEAFEALFDELVRRPAASVGWEPWGPSRIRIARGAVRAALVRTELRNAWPFELTFLATRSDLRDLAGNPSDFPREPNDWLVKADPAELRRWRRGWTYEPHNLGNVPTQTLSDRAAKRHLRRIGEDLTTIAPMLEVLFSRQHVLQELQIRGEGAWCETRWIEDLS